MASLAISSERYAGRSHLYYSDETNAEHAWVHQTRGMIAVRVRKILEDSISGTVLHSQEQIHQYAVHTLCAARISLLRRQKMVVHFVSKSCQPCQHCGVAALHFSCSNFHFCAGAAMEEHGTPFRDVQKLRELLHG